MPERYGYPYATASTRWKTGRNDPKGFDHVVLRESEKN